MAFENLPRSTTRIGYASVRGHKRSCELTRDERSLPQHPANGFIACPDCAGMGEHALSDSRIGDPQSEYAMVCDRCNGEGEIADGLIDPLLLVAKYRKGRAGWAMNERREADRRHYYSLYRMRAMRPCSGLAAAGMLARAQICANAADRALQALQQVAA